MHLSNLISLPAPLQSRRSLPAILEPPSIEAFDDLSVASDQKLAEVPLDVPWVRRFVTGERDIQRMPFRPLTAILSNIGNFTLYFDEQNCLISSFVPGSWAPN